MTRVKCVALNVEASVTDNESGFKKARLVEYDENALRRFREELRTRHSRLSGLSTQYNNAVESVHSDSSLDSGQKLVHMRYWANHRDVADKMASSLEEDIVMIDIELELRSS